MTRASVNALSFRCNPNPYIHRDVLLCFEIREQRIQSNCFIQTYFATPNRYIFWHQYNCIHKFISVLNLYLNDESNATQRCLTGEQKLVTKIISYSELTLSLNISASIYASNSHSLCTCIHVYLNPQKYILCIGMKKK